MFKSKIINTALIILTMVCSQTAVAANIWLVDKTVDKIQVMGTGNAVIYLSELSDEICQGGGKLFDVYENSNGMTARGLDHIISVALAAKV
ncbi:MAG: hypothetical protein HRT35_08010, partial [Algicola sp.]|nr:hypothetical protein [Algicola sp.]